MASSHHDQSDVASKATFGKAAERSTEAPSFGLGLFNILEKQTLTVCSASMLIDRDSDSLRLITTRKKKSSRSQCKSFSPFCGVKY
jgi:hypothetical protein